MSKIHRTSEVFDSKDAYVLNYNELVIPHSPHIKLKQFIEEKQEPPFDEKAFIEEKKGEGEAIIAQANASAEQIIENAQINAEALSNQIKQEAYNEGYNQGIETAKQEYEKKIQDVQDFLEELLEHKKNLFSELEPQIAELCTTISEKILFKDISENSKQFISVIANAITRVSQSESITVILSSEQFSNVDELRQAVLPQVGRIKTVNFKLDDFLNIGDCIVETDCGTVDTGIDTQIENVKQSFSTT